MSDDEKDLLIPLEDAVPDEFEQELIPIYSRLTKIAFAIENTLLGRYLELLDALITTISCIMYLVLVGHVDLIYVRRGEGEDPDYCPDGLVRYHQFCREYVPIELQGADTAICMLLLTVVYLKSFCGLNLRYFYSLNGIVTLLTCIPPIIVFALRCIYDDPEWTLSYLSARYIVYFYPVRWFRLKQSLKILLLPSRTSLPIFANISAVTRKVMGLTITIMLMLLSVSCYIHIFHIIDVQQKADNPKPDLIQQDRSFWETFFFTLMSATSGLKTSIIEVNTWYIQVLLVLVLFSGIFYLPPQVASLINLVKSKSIYSFPYKPEQDTKHVIITGSFSTESLIEFLFEFYHKDHGLTTSTTNAVILYPHEPDEDVVTILNDPMFSSKLHYLKGSSASFVDLKKAKVNQATACFILATNDPKFTGNEIDSEGLMRCIAVRKSNPSITIYAQCLVQENKPHFEVICNKILCIDESKMSFLSQNCKTPGFVTLMHLLTSSIDDIVVDDLAKYANNNEEYSFFADYAHGLGQEFYCISIPNILVNTMFIDAVEVIYHKFDAIVFAVGKKMENKKMKTMICPTEYILTNGDVLIVISSSSDFALKIPHVESSAFSRGTSRVTSRQGSPLAKNSMALPDLLVVNDLLAGAQIGPPSPSNILTTKSPFPTLATDPFVLENALPNSIHNHVLICSNSHTFPRSLSIFVKPFRLHSNAPIVILCPSVCDPAVYRQLQLLKGMYFIRGSPLIVRDLKRANCHLANHIVVLGNNTSSNEYTLDATTITTVLNVQQMKQMNATYCVDLYDMTNSQFTSEFDLQVPKLNDSVDPYMFQSSYMSGNAFSRNMIDTIICQSYYNPFLLSMLKALIINKTAICHHVQIDKESKKWKHVFDDCLLEDGIAFGLYKQVTFKDRKFYMTIPNPSKELIVTKNDYVFVFQQILQ